MYGEGGRGRQKEGEKGRALLVCVILRIEDRMIKQEQLWLSNELLRIQKCNHLPAGFQGDSPGLGCSSFDCKACA